MRLDLLVVSWCEDDARDDRDVSLAIHNGWCGVDSAGADDDGDDNHAATADDAHDDDDDDDDCHDDDDDCHDDVLVMGLLNWRERALFTKSILPTRLIPSLSRYGTTVSGVDT